MMVKSGLRVQSILILAVFLFFVVAPGFAQEEQAVPETEPVASLEQAQALFQQGMYGAAIVMLDKLEDRVEAPDDQVKLYLLKARSTLALGDPAGCEDAVREIFANGLSDRVKTETLEAELQVVFSKVKAEYWFSLSGSKTDEDDERAYQMVIQQAKQKPKKKSLIPKLILGTVLAGILAGGIYLLVSGSSRGADEGETGRLRFENRTWAVVRVEIGDQTRIVKGMGSVHWYSPTANILYVDLNPGVYTLRATATDEGVDIETFIYENINILKGRETNFVFDPYYQ